MPVMTALRRPALLLLLFGLWGGAPATLDARPQNQSFSLRLEESPKALVDEVWQTVNTEFVDPNFNKQDWQQVREKLLARQYTSREDAYKAIREALKGLGDQYTRFLDPSEFKALTEETSGELIGVGVTLQPPGEKNKLPLVVSTVEGGPAAKAGVLAQDQIVEVDDKSVAGLELPEVTRRIKGANGTQVSLTIVRNGGQKVRFTITRSPIELPVVRSSLKQEQGRSVGYIRLAEFSQKATNQVRKAVLDLQNQGAQALVLDLRSNPGGSLDAAVGIANLFLKQGKIVSVVTRNGLRDSVSSEGRPVTELPLAVLVDGGSASASEILAGALQENGRATLVGTRTFGKALVQQMNPLSDGSGVNVTIAHYFTPSGRDIQSKGIEPDIKEPFPKELAKTFKPEQVATAADPQYAKAVAMLLTPARGATATR